MEAPLLGEGVCQKTFYGKPRRNGCPGDGSLPLEATEYLAMM